jgi:hypothetical protein
VKNTALENTGNGIRASGRNGTYTSNLVASNATGIAEQGIGDVLTGNITDSNTANGIDDQGGNSTLIKNIANYNRLDGIVVDDLVIAGFVDGGGNAAKGNDYGTGASPEQCRGVTCG